MTIIKLGVSACLLGQKVRYDGGHKLNLFIKHTLGRSFGLIPICPEVELGLPIPREPIQLERDPCSPRLLAIHTRRDLTRPMSSWIQQKLMKLSELRCGGLILKSGSPSCGLSVPVHGAGGSRKAPGLFAGRAQGFFARLPVIEGERLDHPRERDHFIQNVLLLDKWRRLREVGDASALIAFHEQHLTLLQARSMALARRLVQLRLDARRSPWKDVLNRYDAVLGRLVSLPATRKKNRLVLERLASELWGLSSPWEQRVLTWVIQQYAAGELNLARPRAHLIHLAEKYQHPMAIQAFLSAHP